MRDKGCGTENSPAAVPRAGAIRTVGSKHCIFLTGEWIVPCVPVIGAGRAIGNVMRDFVGRP
jgi:hypothetical protein